MSLLHEHVGPWRFDELADLPDDGWRYEVVDGCLVRTPPPTPWHQLVGNVLLRHFLAACPDEWAPMYEWALPMGTDGRVPDLAVVRTAALPRDNRTPYPTGPENVGLLVEVVSPSSRKTDRFAKPGEYAEAGIPLFWRVETEPDVLLVAHRLERGSYVEVAQVQTQGEVPAPWGAMHVDLAPLR